MPVMTEKEEKMFLEEDGILMRIGVVREDGSPLVTPIWFLYEDSCIYFTPRAKSEWFGCLKRDSRVSLCIDEQTLPYRKIVVEGSAELLYDLGDDDTWRDLYRQIAKRYGPEEMAEAYVQLGECLLLESRRQVYGMIDIMLQEQSFQKLKRLWASLF